MRLERILRRDHPKRRRQVPRHIVCRHTALRHRLQQARLRAGRGPVDLIRQHQVGENRPRLEAKLPALLVKNRHAKDVCRKQVARELDARKLEADRDGERLRKQRLADARHILHQQVAAGEQADDRLANHRLLALENLEHVLLQRPDPRHPLLQLVHSLLLFGRLLKRL